MRQNEIKRILLSYNGWDEFIELTYDADIPDETVWVEILRSGKVPSHTSAKLCKKNMHLFKEDYTECGRFESDTVPMIARRGIIGTEPLNILKMEASDEGFEELFKKALSSVREYKMEKIFKKFGNLINESEELQLLVVNDLHRGNCVQYIENPTKNVQMAAVTYGPYALKYLYENLSTVSEDVLYNSLKQYPFSIKYVPNISDDMLTYMIHHNVYGEFHKELPYEAKQLLDNGKINQEQYSLIESEFKIGYPTSYPYAKF